MEGNNMKMRDALNDIKDELYEIQGLSELDDVRLAKLRRIVGDALAEPERNCDLPKPEERFLEFCSRHMSCSSCPYDGREELRCRCVGKWLLAPAEKSGVE